MKQKFQIETINFDATWWYFSFALTANGHNSTSSHIFLLRLICSRVDYSDFARSMCECVCARMSVASSLWFPSWFDCQWIPAKSKPKSSENDKVKIPQSKYFLFVVRSSIARIDFAFAFKHSTERSIGVNGWRQMTRFMPFRGLCTRTHSHTARNHSTEHLNVKI